MHCGIQHDTCQDEEVAVLCFPIPLLHQGGLVSFLTVERQRITGFPSSYIFHSHSLLSYFHTLALSFAPSHLFFIPFVFCLIFSLLLSHFVAFCLILFSALPLCLSGPLWPHLLPLSSAALGSSLTIRHQNIYSSLLPCSPHLDHVILKSEGTALLFSMSACSWKRKRDWEQERGKRCHPQQSQRDECTLTKSPL